MRYQLRTRSKTRAKKGSAQMAEFAPAMMIFLLIILFPLVNLLSFATGYASLAYLGQQCAVQAANSPSYQLALTEMQNMAAQVTNSGVGKFAKLTPVGGYKGCGADLYITATVIASSTATEYGPNTGLPTTPDPTNNIYEYTVKTSFNVGPFLDLHTFPFVGSIPLVGQPVLLRTVANRAIEHDNSLSFLPRYFSWTLQNLVD